MFTLRAASVSTDTEIWRAPGEFYTIDLIRGRFFGGDFGALLEMHSGQWKTTMDGCSDGEVVGDGWGGWWHAIDVVARSIQGFERVLL